MTISNWIFRVAICLIGCVVLVACEENPTRPSPLVSSAADGSDWAVVVTKARANVQKQPDKSEHRTALLSAIQGAEDHYLTLGRDFLYAQDIANAEGAFSKGLLIVPESQVLRDELEELKDKKKAAALTAQGESSFKLGRTERAIRQLEEALQIDPNNSRALHLLNHAYGSTPIHSAPKPIRLKSSAPVTVNFRGADMKEAFLTLGKNYGLNVIFDAELDDQEVTLYAERVSFDQAFRLMLKASGNHFRPMGENSVLIYKDSPEARAANTDFHVRTIYLESAPAEQVSALIERVLDVKNVSANAENNSITLRTTREKLALAERLIRSNDRGKAEVSLEVEILEVNRTKSENLGVDIGSQITVSPPTVTLGEIRRGEARSQLATSVVTLPASSIKFFKQDVDARTLASPRIRTVSQKLATIHIGDRVPLRAATVLDSNGQSRTSFEYRDIGIKLEVTPKVLLDETVDVQLNLEVSSLGQNLGTADESAFSIGTRNVETNMVLNDTETAIIGGLIRDEERVSLQSVPGLGKIPVVGKLFEVRDGQGTRTDILLTLTPRIVKKWDIPSPADTEFFSGTGASVSSENEFAFLDDGAPSGAVIRLDLGKTQKPAPATPSPVLSAPKPTLVAPSAPPTPATNANSPSLGFSGKIFNLDQNQTVSVPVVANGISGTGPFSFKLRYNNKFVSAENARVTAGKGSATVNNDVGEIAFSEVIPNADGSFATVELSGKSKGLSYFLIELAQPFPGEQDPQLGSAKIVIK